MQFLQTSRWFRRRRVVGFDRAASARSNPTTCALQKLHSKGNEGVCLHSRRDRVYFCTLCLRKELTQNSECLLNRTISLGFWPSPPALANIFRLNLFRLRLTWLHCLVCVNKEFLFSAEFRITNFWKTNYFCRATIRGGPSSWTEWTIKYEEIDIHWQIGRGTLFAWWLRPCLCMPSVWGRRSHHGNFLFRMPMFYRCFSIFNVRCGRKNAVWIRPRRAVGIVRGTIDSNFPSRSIMLGFSGISFMAKVHNNY